MDRRLMKSRPGRSGEAAPDEAIPPAPAWDIDPAGWSGPAEEWPEGAAAGPVEDVESSELRPSLAPTGTKSWPGAALSLGASILLHLGILAFLLFGLLSQGLSGGLTAEEVVMVGLYGALPGPPGGGSGPKAEAGAESEEQAREEPSAEANEPAPDQAGPPPPPETEIPVLERRNKPPEPELTPLALQEETRPEAPQTARRAKPAEKARPEKQKASPGPNQGRTAGKNAAGTGENAGPGQGQGGGGGGVSVSGYVSANFKYITRHIQRKMIYPQEAKRQGITGTARVAFTISRNGQASDIRIRQSSGNALLDQAALSAVQRASPFPAPPAPARVTIPLTFNLK